MIAEKAPEEMNVNDIEPHNIRKAMSSTDEHLISGALPPKGNNTCHDSPSTVSDEKIEDDENCPLYPSPATTACTVSQTVDDDQVPESEVESAYDIPEANSPSLDETGPLKIYKFTNCLHAQVPSNLDNVVPTSDVEFPAWLASLDDHQKEMEFIDIRGQCYECHSKQVCSRCSICYVATSPKPTYFCECSHAESRNSSKNVFDGTPVQKSNPYFHSLWKRIFVDSKFTRSTDGRQDHLRSAFKRLTEQLEAQQRENAQRIQKLLGDAASKQDMERFIRSSKDTKRKRQHEQAMEEFVNKNSKVSRVMKNYENPDPPPLRTVCPKDLCANLPFAKVSPSCVIDCTESATARRGPLGTETDSHLTDVQPSFSLHPMRPFFRDPTLTISLDRQAIKDWLTGTSRWCAIDQVAKH